MMDRDIDEMLPLAIDYSEPIAYQALKLNNFLLFQGNLTVTFYFRDNFN